MVYQGHMTSHSDTGPPQAVEQRIALGDALVKLGADYPDLVVLSPDVSLSTRATKFKAAFPDRFICTGISEQNTLGMAAGLSTMGWTPVVAGYAMFVVGKAWEPMRNSIAYSHLNVKIVATHAGINVGADGVTHQAIEDIALMRAVPGMVVLAPTDANQVEPALRAALDTPGPVYIRLERAAIPLITRVGAPFTIGKSLTLRQGDDAAIIGIGSMAAIALESAQLLAHDGIQARVISMVSLKPLDEGAVLQAAQETGAIVVAEDHSRHGGLGGAVAEALARLAPVPMEQVALADVFAESGTVEALRAKYGLTAGDIVRAVRLATARRDRLRRT
jgi:transketolase